MAGLDPPAFGAQRLLLFGTGSLRVAQLPSWVDWLRLAYPTLDYRIVLTRSAERFVSRQALAAATRRPVAVDVWSDADRDQVPDSVHVEYASWPDAIVVYPATFNFLARFATGLADTPVLLALQCTTAVIGVAPSVPPGAVTSPAYRAHLAELARRPNVTVLAPVMGVSAHSGEVGIGAAGPLPSLLNRVETLRRGRGPGTAGGDGHVPAVRS
jgi:phosphopantothenoylcysteine synthetase/decarboxylase